MRSIMVNRRSCKYRRVNKDRRKEVISSYSDPEKLSFNQQRISKERREDYRNIFKNRILSYSNEGRRSGVEQRLFPYAGIIHERRSGKDRRGII